jgi:DNA-binding transcriptional MocR family regulator
VITELPTYPGALDAVRANGGRVVPVPMAPGGGWQVDQLRATLRQSAARLAYLIPDFQNPTGALMPEVERREILRVARRTGTTVVVDDSLADLSFGDVERPTAALDATVVTLGSLSKPVWGGLRIGWLRGPTDLVQRLAALRTTIDLSGAVLDQLIAADLVPHLDEIAAARVADLQPQCHALLASLARELPAWRAVVPKGGLSLWVELDAPLATPLTMLAAHAGVVAVPGARFGVDGTFERFLRLPFSLPPARLDEAVRRLAGVWSEVTGRHRVAGPLVVA